MVNKKFFLGMLVIALVFGMTVIGCDNGGDGGGGELVIKDVPTDKYNLIETYGGKIGIFTEGTNIKQALNRTNLVTESELEDAEVSGSGPYTITISLYDNTGDKWKGSGKYDIYVKIDIDSNPLYYEMYSVKFSSGGATVYFNDALSVVPN